MPTGFGKAMARSSRLPRAARLTGFWVSRSGGPLLGPNSERTTAMNISSILRHWLTLALTAATVFLGAHLLAPDETKAFDEAAKQLVAPLVIIGTLLATAIWRIALAWIGNLFRRGSGEPTNNASGGNALLVLIACTVAALGGLPSCSAEQFAAARAIPIKTCVITDKGTICYSSKSGLSAEIDATSGK